ncbi:MAG TPA: FHA domain-containing protein [Labilithrix sp.]|nr:FHA domain-containing protein [Labilithrix sp.]
MEFEVGIVCGRCEAFATLGSTTCPSCSNALVLHATETSSDDEPISDGPVTTRESGELLAGDAASGVHEVEREITLEPLVRTTTRELTSVNPPESFAQASGSSPPGPTRSVRPSGHFAGIRSSTKPKSLEELMDQAKNFVCRSCSTPVPVGHKFCGRCGAAVPPEIMNARTQFFGQLQAPGKAKLILIRGEGVEGLSYQLNAEQHVVGKAGQLVFPDDPFVSPKHANFFYRDGALCVRDEGSLNGVYIRVRGTLEISPEDHFLAGEQVFRVDGPPKLHDQPGPDGTFFYSSPKHHSPFRITQMLQGGAYGMTVCARSSTLQIGREGGDLNFPTDLYMSGSHCKIEESNGVLSLTDLGSRNGTYVRLKAERELGHGDYLFIGRKLLRVEITAA